MSAGSVPACSATDPSPDNELEKVAENGLGVQVSAAHTGNQNGVSGSCLPFVPYLAICGHHLWSEPLFFYLSLSLSKTDF